MKYCTKCGATETEAGQFGMIEITGYDWDSDEDTLAIGTLDENFHVDLVERDPQEGSRLEELGPFISVQLNARINKRGDTVRIGFFADTVTDANALAELLLMRVDTVTMIGAPR